MVQRVANSTIRESFCRRCISADRTRVDEEIFQQIAAIIKASGLPVQGGQRHLSPSCENGPRNGKSARRPLISLDASCARLAQENYRHGHESINPLGRASDARKSRPGKRGGSRVESDSQKKMARNFMTVLTCLKLSGRKHRARLCRSGDMGNDVTTARAQLTSQTRNRRRCRGLSPDPSDCDSRATATSCEISGVAAPYISGKLLTITFKCYTTASGWEQLFTMLP